MLIARCDASEVFDFQKEPFDEIAFAIKGVVAGELRRRFSGRDDSDGALFDDGLAKRFRVVALVTKNMLGRKTVDQGLGFSVIACLSRRKNEPEWIAQGVDDRVDFGRQPTP